jgi:phosphohistidine phosphatase
LKTLYLLRHAKAESAHARENDFDRKLAERGREACQDVGEYMKAKNYLPQLVLSSSSARTTETFALVMQAAGIAPAHQFEKTLYLATADDVLRHIHLVSPDVESLLMIGHNPGMHHIALILAEPKSSDLHVNLELKYPTASLTVLCFNVDSWTEVSSGMGELLDFMTPSEL